MKKETVVLLGASGTMGYQAFKELWKRRDRLDISILLRPSAKNKSLFAGYGQGAGVPSITGAGVAQGNGFKIVWGDATAYDDVEEAIRGADWVLSAMAFISPQADYYPQMAKAVNTGATVNIVRAIEAQPGGAERIRFIYTGTVAQTGDRLGCISWGRVGDPLKPSILDTYAVTKIAGERAVLESNIKHWASLRMTFIMPTDHKRRASLMDPIMFHQPIASCMENLTDRDAGYGLVQALDIDDGSDFWRRVYNMGGGPAMRCTAYDYMDRSFRLMGMSGLQSCTQRKWFALRNFHMQYFEDSDVLNEYLHHWRDTLDDYWQATYDAMPAGMRALALFSRHVPFLRRRIEEETCSRMTEMAENHRNGTAHWYANRNEPRITAFYGDYETYESIPDWDGQRPPLDPDPQCERLDHGYDETKARLELADLHGAAAFRGGACLSGVWNGDMYTTLDWRCAFGHDFQGKPYTILKAGHWCPVCVAPPWNYDEEARRNPFFAQVWLPNHDPGENNVYSAELCQDIAGADKE
jgi:nucleoside-diphosphate-sugar epimerase